MIKDKLSGKYLTYLLLSLRKYEQALLEQEASFNLYHRN